jgi:hypothetical protein
MDPERMAVLPHEHHAVLVVDGDHRDGAGVTHDLPDAVPAAGHRDGVQLQGDHPALVDRLPCQHAVPVRLGVTHQASTLSPSSSGRRAASW